MTYFHKLSISLVLVLCITYTPNKLLSKNSNSNPKKLNISEKYIDSIMAHSDSGIAIIEDLFHQTMRSNDLLNHFTIAFHLGKWYGDNQYFSEAFEYGTEAMEVSKLLNDTLLMAKSSSYLGILHNYFTKTDEAIKLLKGSNEYYKSLFKSGQVNHEQLIASYYSLIQLYQWFDSVDMAAAYIDTCYMLSEKYGSNEKGLAFFDAENAKILTRAGKVDSAIYILESKRKLFEEIDDTDTDMKRFLIIIYLYLGDAYFAAVNNSKAITYYSKCIDAIEFYNFNKGYRINAHKNLSLAYFNVGNYEKAYQSLKIMSDLNDKYFSTRSSYNADLIKINNKYKELVDKQRIELLEKQKYLLVFRIIIIAIILLAVVALLFYRIKRQKLKLQKRNEQVESEKKESDQQLRVRNKELTEHTLKLIEKETILKELAGQLKKVAPKDKESQNMAKSALGDSKVLWEDFNTRFVSVNTDFYKRLEKKFPGLSPTEQKHCALIKLNFSSKEMAQLLGISLTGINVARYRLRQKFGLTRDVNLVKFLNEL